ncbi:helix-turn-helix domain-containing protein [Actinokineospora sp.]|uniref:helix-turn-helix domain-containing protein n=1 Tax=Actinokineospora sp. TaxID=1872133 RepID=UPI0040378E29
MSEPVPRPDDIARAVGHELRRARDAAGWTRSDLVAKLPSDIHVQTLATYEQGVRHCTVARLVEICRALGVPAAELLSLALQRAAVDLHRVELRVDLRAVARDRRTELEPLRAWARHRLDDDADGTGVARLDPVVIHEMAAFCGLSRSAMLHMLVEFTPELDSRPT